MEIFCYILTRDDSEFLAIREDILLRIMDIVDAAGTGFAFPSQTVYLGRDTGMDKEKAERVAREVQKWREEPPVAIPRLHARRHFRNQQFAALSPARFGGRAKGRDTLARSAKSCRAGQSRLCAGIS